MNDLIHRIQDFLGEPLMTHDDKWAMNYRNRCPCDYQGQPQFFQDNTFYVFLGRQLKLGAREHFHILHDRRWEWLWQITPEQKTTLLLMIPDDSLRMENEDD